MNARSHATADPAAAAVRGVVAILHALAPTLRAVSVVLACGFAQAQDGIADLVTADARRWLHHPDPEVRGEAALIVAATADTALQGELLAMAKEPAAAARHRALIALGLCGSPTAVQFLGTVLEDTGTRGDADGTAAAFGLGLVTSGNATTATTHTLSAIAQSSWKRQRDTLLALLLAMSRQPQRTETVALRRLFDDDSNRDPEVRGLLLQLLLPNDVTLEDKNLRKLLVRGSDAERLPLLQWFGREGGARDAEWLSTLERLTSQGDTPELRAAAMAALTRARHLPTLDLAMRALRDATPVECGQALRSLLAIGGAGMLRAAAPRVVEERDPARKAAMLRNFDAPLPRELADHCSRLASDANQPWPLRNAAALALAHSDGPRGAPLLRDNFRATTDAASLPALAMAVSSTHDEPVALARLVDGGVDLRGNAARWVALLQAEHPESQRQVLASLQHADVHGPSPLAALRAWRAATVLAVPKARAEAVPALLKSLLGVEGS